MHVNHGMEDSQNVIKSFSWALKIVETETRKRKKDYCPGCQLVTNSHNVSGIKGHMHAIDLNQYRSYVPVWALL
jgi:hypothetical protein